VWCSPVPAPPTDTRADPASARRGAGAARGRVGRAGGPLWCGPSQQSAAWVLGLGLGGAFSSHLASRKLPSDSSPRSPACHFSVATHEHTTSLLLRTACAFAAPALTAEGPRSPRAARALPSDRPPRPPRYDTLMACFNIARAAGSSSARLSESGGAGSRSAGSGAQSCPLIFNRFRSALFFLQGARLARPSCLSAGSGPHGALCV
jgi:hypothetical protein